MAHSDTPGDQKKTGYKNPPTHTRWPKGQSGNPDGRKKREAEPALPAGLSKEDAMILRLHGEMVDVKVNGRKRRMTHAEKIERALMDQAAAGDVRAIKLVSERRARALAARDRIEALESQTGSVALTLELAEALRSKKLAEANSAPHDDSARPDAPSPPDAEPDEEQPPSALADDHAADEAASTCHRRDDAHEIEERRRGVDEAERHEDETGEPTLRRGDAREAEQDAPADADHEPVCGAEDCRAGRMGEEPAAAVPAPAREPSHTQTDMPRSGPVWGNAPSRPFPHPTRLQGAPRFPL
jgi:hypothetical protein